MKEFKPDFGFAIPNRTKKECPSPEFSDHKLLAELSGCIHNKLFIHRLYG